jgi:hypothetical protein
LNSLQLLGVPGVANVSIWGQPERQLQVQEGRILRLGDVATGMEERQPLIGDAVVNDGPSLMPVVERFPCASTTQVTEDLQEELERHAPGHPRRRGRHVPVPSRGLHHVGARALKVRLDLTTHRSTDPELTMATASKNMRS